MMNRIHPKGLIALFAVFVALGPWAAYDLNLARAASHESEATDEEDLSLLEWLLGLFGPQAAQSKHAPPPSDDDDDEDIGTNARTGTRSASG